MEYLFKLLFQAQEKGLLSPILLLLVLAGSIYAQNVTNDNLRSALDKQGTDLKDAIGLMQGQIGPIARQLANTAESLEKVSDKLSRIDENGTLAEMRRDREELKALRDKMDRQAAKKGG